MAASKRVPVGIDFGTSTSFLAHSRKGGGADILPLGSSRRYLPSLAGRRFDDIVVGEDATTLTPDRIIRSVKRAITEDQPTVRIGGRHGTEEMPRDDVITAILREIGRQAKAKGSPLRKNSLLRLACPAMWVQPQRRLLHELAGRAGLPMEQAMLVEEPVAAGIGWLDSQPADAEPVDGRLLVFDMGGGTLDLAVMRVLGGARPEITVLASVGISCAGDDLDELIATDLQAELGSDLDTARDPSNARAELLRQATEAKIALSAVSNHGLVFTRRFFGTERLPTVRYSRERLEDAFRPQLHSAETLIWHALKIARLTHLRGSSTPDILRLTPQTLAGDIDYVLLVGGMSRVPYVRRRISELFPHAKIIHDAGMPADEAIVAGLVSTTGYNTVNMYRPGFNFDLSWPGGDRRLYQAHSPLFQIAQLQNGQSHIGHRERLGARQGIPRQHRGELRVQTTEGQPVNLLHRAGTVNPVTETVQVLPVAFGHHEVQFTLYCDGRISLIDGSGRDHELRIEGWPEVVGTDTKPVPMPAADVPVYYPYNRS